MATFAEWWQANQLSSGDARFSSGDARFIAEKAWNAARLNELGELGQTLHDRCGHSPRVADCPDCEMVEMLLARVERATE